MQHLTTDELYDVRDAAFAAGLADPHTRLALFQGVMPQFRGALPALPSPIQQLHSDLLKMNEVGRLVDGKVPLELWLHNAVRETAAAEHRAVLQDAYDKVTAQLSAEPEMPPEQLDDLPEEIVHQDDTVAYYFLRRGWEAGAAVARLRVPQFSGEQPRKVNNVDAPAHLGTGWLVTPSLVMTNHHVVASRESGEVDTVAEADLRLQGANAKASSTSTPRRRAGGAPVQRAGGMGARARLRPAAPRRPLGSPPVAAGAGSGDPRR